MINLKKAVITLQVLTVMYEIYAIYGTSCADYDVWLCSYGRPSKKNRQFWWCSFGGDKTLLADPQNWIYGYVPTNHSKFENASLKLDACNDFLFGLEERTKTVPGYVCKKATPCTDGWEEWTSGNCYKVYYPPNGTDYTTSRNDCTDKGAALASVASITELKEILATIKQLTENKMTTTVPSTPFEETTLQLTTLQIQLDTTKEQEMTTLLDTTTLKTTTVDEITTHLGTTKSKETTILPKTTIIVTTDQFQTTNPLKTTTLLPETTPEGTTEQMQTTELSTTGRILPKTTPHATTEDKIQTTSILPITQRLPETTSKPPSFPEITSMSTLLSRTTSKAVTLPRTTTKAITLQEITTKATTLPRITSKETTTKLSKPTTTVVALFPETTLVPAKSETSIKINLLQTTKSHLKKTVGVTTQGSKQFSTKSLTALPFLISQKVTITKEDEDTSGSLGTGNTNNNVPTTKSANEFNTTFSEFTIKSREWIPPKLVKTKLLKPDYLPSERLNPDKEPFSIFMGTTAIILIICFVLGIFLMDLNTFIRDFKRMRRNVQSFIRRYNVFGYGNKYIATA